MFVKLDKKCSTDRATTSDDSSVISNIETNIKPNSVDCSYDTCQSSNSFDSELSFQCSSSEIEQYMTKHKPVLDFLLDRVSENECPYIAIELYGKSFKGLLDSGANQIFINEHTFTFLRNLGVKLTPDSSISCTVANNTKLSCLGYVTIPIKLQDKVHIFDCYVLPELRHNIVLGTIFWVKMGLIPDLRRGCWYFVDNNCVDTLDLQVKYTQTTDDLTLEQRNKVKQIIDEYFETVKDIKLGCTNLIEHEIKTNSPPIKQRYYPVSPFMQQKIDKEIDKMLELDVIEPSTSGWSSPILMVPKKDSTYRFVVDFRKLNAVTEKCAYPLPYISSVLDSLGNAKYLSSLDITSAYWQVKMSESSKKYTAFTIPARGLFQFKRMAFGLCNAPATFQKLVDTLFGPEYSKYVFRYLDDIIIVSNDFSMHLKLLRSVFQKLLEANLILYREKCCFFR